MRPNRATPELCPSPTRRRMLTGAAAAAVAVPTAALPALAAGESHSDAKLLAAWEKYVEIEREYATASRINEDLDYSPFFQASKPYRVIITDTDAQTIAGVAVQLPFIFAAKMECTDSHDTAGPLELPPDLLRYGKFQWYWP